MRPPARRSRPRPIKRVAAPTRTLLNGMRRATRAWRLLEATCANASTRAQLPSGNARPPTRPGCRSVVSSKASVVRVPSVMARVLSASSPPQAGKASSVASASVVCRARTGCKFGTTAPTLMKRRSIRSPAECLGTTRSLLPSRLDRKPGATPHAGADALMEFVARALVGGDPSAPQFQLQRPAAFPQRQLFVQQVVRAWVGFAPAGC